MNKQRRILVALRLSFSSNRAYLSGIARFRKKNPNWRVTIVEGFTDFDQTLSTSLEDGSFEGIITVRPHESYAATVIEGCPIPIALLGTATGDLSNRKQATVFVRSDNPLIGKIVARQFARYGAFASYACIGVNAQTTWARERIEGFSKELKAHRISPVIIDSPYPDGTPKDHLSLVNAINRLPKPLALFAVYDNRALNAIEACRDLGMNIPADVSIIGVDNDPILCEFATPSLSSVSTNPECEGFIAALELDKLINQRSQETKIIVNNTARIIERESTTSISPGLHLVERGFSYIKANACNNITPRNVAAHLGVSRSLADLRFREFAKTSITAEINRSRINELQRKLRTTNLPIHHICALCGFASQEYAMRLFKKTCGVTMTCYRANTNHSISSKL